jgi:hypothetical protein
MSTEGSARVRRGTRYAIAIAVLMAVGTFVISDTARFVVLTSAYAVLYGSPTDKDWEGANALFEKVISVHHFELDSRSVPGRPPVFFSPGSKFLLTLPTEIQVYDVLDSGEQNRILAALQKLIRSQNLRPARVRFLVYENWIQSGGFGSRGPETQMRLVYIDATRVKEEGGQKQIAHPNP